MNRPGKWSVLVIGGQYGEEGQSPDRKKMNASNRRSISIIIVMLLGTTGCWGGDHYYLTIGPERPIIGIDNWVDLTFSHVESPSQFLVYKTDMEEWEKLWIMIPYEVELSKPVTIDGSRCSAVYSHGGMAACQKIGDSVSGKVTIESRSSKEIIADLDIAVERACGGIRTISGRFVFR
jgi:hypothetical protein